MTEKRTFSGSAVNLRRRLHGSGILIRCMECPELHHCTCKKTAQIVIYPISGPIPDFCPLPEAPEPPEAA